MLYSRIKQLRLENKWNQQELAKRIGVGRTTITEYEAGRIMPPYEKIQAMAKIFDVSVKYLMGESNSKNEPTDDVQDIAEQLAKMIDDLNDPNTSIIFDGKPLDAESKIIVEGCVKSALQMARHLNKNKGEQ